MTKKHDDIKAIQTAIENLANHPPETPMEKLRAALLVAEANQFLADEAENAERLRRRTTLPDGYRIQFHKPTKKRPDDELWSVLCSGVKIGSASYRQKANEMAWAHHDYLFET